MSPNEPIRIAKVMAARGLCSRREAERLIACGGVYVEGEQVVAPGTRIDPDATITLDESARKQLREKVTVLLHKPIGVVSGQPEKGYVAAVSLITPENRHEGDRTPLTLQASHLEGLAAAGRLDIDSHGLLVLTQDGVVARRLIGSATKVEKEYLVRFEGELTAENLRLLNHGLYLDDKPLKPARVVRLNENQLMFTLREGRKRQIRRMCEQVGLSVVRLKRTRIGNVMLADLPYGKWRFLAHHEQF